VSGAVLDISTKLNDPWYWSHFVAAVVNEATLAFDLNTGIFDALETLVVNSKENERVIDASLKISKYNPDRTYALISVAAFITAGPYIKLSPFPNPSLTAFGICHPACLAHYILVTGGFSGAKEHRHLLAFEHCWLSSLFSGSSPH